MQDSACNYVTLHTIHSFIQLFVRSFIHSKIYIASLWGNYWEELPTPARSKRAVFNLNIYFSRLIPQVAENAAARALSEAKPLAWQRPSAYAEGLQEGEVQREGGDSRGKRVGESIPDGWRPEASPPADRSPEAKASVETRCLPSHKAKLCLCLSLTQTLSHTQKDGETETVKT